MIPPKSMASLGETVELMNGSVAGSRRGERTEFMRRALENMTQLPILALMFDVECSMFDVQFDCYLWTLANDQVAGK